MELLPNDWGELFSFDNDLLLIKEAKKACVDIKLITKSEKGNSRSGDDPFLEMDQLTGRYG